MMISKDPEKQQMCRILKAMLNSGIAAVPSGVYRLLVIRGAFFMFDPIKRAKVGDILHFRPECCEHFLLRNMRANFWIDTAPSSVSQIRIWNRTLLMRMGSLGRGFSAHRSGLVSRTCILAILASKAIEVMIRWGGWQAVTGAKTVLRIYARKVIDKYLDPYGLSLGYEPSDLEWEQKRKEYLGRPRYPEQPVVHRGRRSLPFQIKVHAWRSKRWIHFLRRLNDICSDIMSAALADREIMPVHRYREARRAFRVFISERAEFGAVQEYLHFLAMRQYVWSRSANTSIALALESHNPAADDGKQVANSILASAPGHPFWMHLLTNIMDRAVHSDKWHEVDAIQETGPGAVSRAFNEFSKMHSLPITLAPPGLLVNQYQKGAVNGAPEPCIYQWVFKAMFNSSACKAEFPEAYAIAYWTGSWNHEG